jgi:antibiotic biosynthesis monooxygenase (ABM) superfamily enzyme
MIWFEYTYISSHEIIEKAKLLTEYSIIDTTVLIILFISTISIIYYVIPYLNLYNDYLEKEKIKKNKRNLLRRIKLQKEIEEKLAKQINIK